jgi:hypothetical protein
MTIMIEVFKTNVTDSYHAKLLLQEIHKRFSAYKANFDLDDCDRILRVVSHANEVDSEVIISLLKNAGFYAEVLEDDEPSTPIQVSCIAFSCPWFG